jgi:hypothetical protein
MMWGDCKLIDQMDNMTQSQFSLLPFSSPKKESSGYIKHPMNKITVNESPRDIYYEDGENYCRKY